MIFVVYFIFYNNNKVFVSKYTQPNERMCAKFLQSFNLLSTINNLNIN